MKSPDASYLDRPISLEDAKINFLKAAENISPLKPVREHPFISIGTAFLLGMGGGALGKRGVNASFLIGQMADIAIKIAPLLILRARGSGG